MSISASVQCLDALFTEYGADSVLRDETSRSFYSADIYSVGVQVAAVLRPRNCAELQHMVRVCYEAGLAILPRGGGVSYTSGYLAAAKNSVLIDTAAMNRVLEINREDMYVTVEAGCSWKRLHEALQGSGLRTPFWGPLSGRHATIGGAVSQHAIFWGAGAFGASADSVQSLAVVLGSGELLKTGSAALKDGVPFDRYYGPDLTGLFCCDCGALGVKAQISLKLIPELPEQAHMSFEFDTHAQQIQAMSEIARQDLAAQIFGTDPGLADARSARESLLADVKALGGVLKRKGGLRQGAKIALSGRGFIKPGQHALHMNVEERHASAAQAKLQAGREICKQLGGREIANSIPAVLRANPFSPLNNAMGPNGERWVPVHAIVPHSRALDCMEAVREVFDQHADAMQQHQILTGVLTTTVARGSFVIEPLWFWPDAGRALHKHIVEPAVWLRNQSLQPDPDAAHLVAEMRRQLIAFFASISAIHLQIGRTYPYHEHLSAPAAAAIKAFKTHFDPKGLMNPGALGF